MSEQPDTSEVLANPKGYVSERGAFEINANPTVKRPYARAEVPMDRAAEGISHKKLAARYGEKEAQQKVAEMVKATVPGTSTTMLLSQDGPNGMMLVHVWFGANFSLFRHSHPKLGDCLYYVIAGEILMGKRRLGRGSTFFVPNGQPYKYTAGPAGVELLEFRAGGGDPATPAIEFGETSLEAIQQIIDIAYDNDALWKAPERMGDTALLQAEFEFASQTKGQTAEP